MSDNTGLERRLAIRSEGIKDIENSKDTISTEASNNSNDGIVAIIDVGEGPMGEAISQDNKKIYVANAKAGTLSVIDIKSNTVIKTVEQVGTTCSCLSMMRNTSRAYVGCGAWIVNWGTGLLSSINTLSNTVLKNNIVSGYAVQGIGILPNGTRAYISDFNNDRIVIINTAVNRAILPPITVGDRPLALVLSSSGNIGYVDNYDDGTVSIFNTITNQVTATVSIGIHPWAMALTPNERYLYITSDPGIVYVMDTRTNLVIKEIEISNGYLDGICVSPMGDRVYVSNSEYNQVIEIDTATNEVINPPFEVGEYPNGIVITPDGRYAYVANKNSNNVYVLDLKAERGGFIG